MAKLTISFESVPMPEGSPKGMEGYAVALDTDPPVLASEFKKNPKAFPLAIVMGVDAFLYAEERSKKIATGISYVSMEEAMAKDKSLHDEPPKTAKAPEQPKGKTHATNSEAQASFVISIDRLANGQINIGFEVTEPIAEDATECQENYKKMGEQNQIGICAMSYLDNLLLRKGLGVDHVEGKFTEDSRNVKQSELEECFRRLVGGIRSGQRNAPHRPA